MSVQCCSSPTCKGEPIYQRTAARAKTAVDKMKEAVADRIRPAYQPRMQAAAGPSSSPFTAAPCTPQLRSITPKRPRVEEGARTSPAHAGDASTSRGNFTIVISSDDETE
jgi:hypothetical protein